MPSRGILFLLALLLVSGCANPAPKEATSPPSVETQTMVPPTPTEKPAENVSISDAPPVELMLDGCTQWDAGWNLLPLALTPGQPPSGWERNDPTSPLSGVGVNGFECQKIGLGHFERGPIHFLIESHGNMELPPQCRADVTTNSVPSFSVLAGIYLDDPELAAFLNLTFGMPVFPTTFDHRSQAVGSVMVHELSWTPEGAETSHVSISDHGLGTFPAPVAYQYYWANGNGLVRLQMDHVLQIPAVGNVLISNMAGVGEFHAPMLMSQVADGNFAGNSDWYPSFTGTNKFTVYGDHFCESTLSG